MTSDLIALLLRLTLFTSITLLLLLILRAPLRRWLGVAAAYQAWLLVPVVTLVASLPTRSTPVIHVASAVRRVHAMAAHLVPAPSLPVDLLLIVWAAGALALAAWFVRGHRAFLRQAGALRRTGDVYISAGGAGPASVGLFAPVIIVPIDFQQRYAVEEQALVLAHEQVHIARRDALANLLQAAFQCVFWFNPLVHLAAARFRQDQELSCDARVMTLHPRQRRCYAEALLKAHAASVPLHGIHCHWQSRHPTKDRIMQLHTPSPGLLRRRAGRAFVAMLAVTAIGATLVARAESTVTYAIAMTMDAGGVQSAPRVLAKAGEQFAVASGAWRIEMTVRPAGSAGSVWMTSKIYKDAQVVSAPNLLAHVDEKAVIKVGASDDPFALTMVVTPQR